MHCNEKHKKSQIKGELQLVCMNKTINFVSKKFEKFEKDSRKKDENIKNLSKKIPSEMAQRIDKIRDFSRPTRTIFTT